MCLKRHIISLDLREYADKNTIYQVVQTPDVGNSKKNTNYSKSIILLEEFDMTIKELDRRSILREKEIDLIINNSMNNCNEDAIAKNKNVKNKIIYNEFLLKDLLELLQGPVPLHGSIIIATTNEFDNIYDLCPELFRPGRLTPVHFGYVTKEIFQEICEFYFEQKFKEFLPDSIKIPTSQIIELAIECTFLCDNKFEYFKNKFIELLD